MDNQINEVISKNIKFPPAIIESKGKIPDQSCAGEVKKVADFSDLKILDDVGAVIELE